LSAQAINLPTSTIASGLFSEELRVFGRLFACPEAGDENEKFLNDDGARRSSDERWPAVSRPVFGGSENRATSAAPRCSCGSRQTRPWLPMGRRILVSGGESLEVA